MKAEALIQHTRRNTPKPVRSFLAGFTISVVATIDGLGA
jgi:hypothetical protein